MAIASVLKYYNGAITRSDVKSMPNRELLSYIDAANKLEGESPKEKGLEGQDAINAMKYDPAIRIKDANIRRSKSKN
jgi:hypothetical protein